MSPKCHTGAVKNRTVTLPDIARVAAAAWPSLDLERESPSPGGVPSLRESYDLLRALPHRASGADPIRGRS